jgi:type III secretory pathway component EscS
MGPDPNNEHEAPVVFGGLDITRWAFAIFAAASAFAITVAARAFLYKGGEPGELPVWAVSTVVGVIVGTVCAPPQRSRAARSFFIGLAVSVSLVLLLGDVASSHRLNATGVERLAGAVIGGIAARLILLRA